MSIYHCPHCDREFSASGYTAAAVPVACKPLTPIHSWTAPDDKSYRCPGSEQTPRNAESDRRPLWKDDPEIQGAKRR